nr:response regulator [Gammaproteobacteria bacterium]
MKRAKHAPATGRPPLRAAPNRRTRRQHLSVLIVATDASIRQTLGLAFTERGYRVEQADTVQHAANRLRQRRFDIALLDAGLPESDAAQLLSCLHAPQVSLVAMIWLA